MAIAFDAASSGGNTTGSSTHAHTCTGADRLLFACVGTATNDTCTGVTYAAVAMIKIGTSRQNAGNSAWVTLWYLAAPATGANNIVATNSAATQCNVAAASYVGCAQSGIPNTLAVGTTQGLAVTPAVNNCWVLMAQQTNASPTTAGAGTTRRAEGANNWGNTIFDNNAAVSPPAATTLTAGNGTVWTGYIIAFAPPYSGNMFLVF